MLDVEIRLLSGASATGAANFSLFLAVALPWRAGFRAVLEDVLDGTGFFNGGLLIVGGDEWEDETGSIAFR